MGASQQLATFFANNLGKPISRNQVRQIASQLDYMKRIRLNGGARDILHPLGVAILWGKGDAALIAALNLGAIPADSFVAYKPQNASERLLIRQHGHPIA